MDWFYLTCGYIVILFLYLMKKYIEKDNCRNVYCFFSSALIGWQEAKITVTIDSWMCTINCIFWTDMKYVTWPGSDQISSLISHGDGLLVGKSITLHDLIIYLHDTCPFIQRMNHFLRIKMEDHSKVQPNTMWGKCIEFMRVCSSRHVRSLHWALLLCILTKCNIVAALYVCSVWPYIWHSTDKSCLAWCLC